MNISIIARLLACFSLLPMIAACNGESSKIFISSIHSRARLNDIPNLPASATVDINFDLSATEGNQINEIQAWAEIRGSRKLITTLPGSARMFTWNVDSASTLKLNPKEVVDAQLILIVKGRTATTENASNPFKIANIGTIGLSKQRFFRNTNTAFEIGTCNYDTNVAEPYCQYFDGTTAGQNCSITCANQKLSISGLPAPVANTSKNISTFLGIRMRGQDIKFQLTPVIYLDQHNPTPYFLEYKELLGEFKPFDTVFEKVVTTNKLAINFKVKDLPAVTDNQLSTTVKVSGATYTPVCTGTYDQTCSVPSLILGNTAGKYLVDILSKDQAGNVKSHLLYYFDYQPTSPPVITTLSASKGQFAAIEKGDSLGSILKDHSLDVPANHNGAGLYHLRFKLVDPDDHSPLNSVRMASGLSTIKISVIDKNGSVTSTVSAYDSPRCDTPTIKAGSWGQYYCYKIEAKATTDYFKVTATDASGNAATRVFRINLGTGARVLAGADSGPMNNSGNQSANFSKTISPVFSERGMKIDSRGVIYILRYDGSYDKGDIYAVHPIDGIVHKLVTFNKNNMINTLSKRSSTFTFANPYVTSIVTSFDLDAKDDSILYLSELRIQSDGKYKPFLQRFKLNFKTTFSPALAEITMIEDEFVSQNSSYLELKSETGTAITYNTNPEHRRIQVYSINHGLFYSGYEQGKTKDDFLYINSLINDQIKVIKLTPTGFGFVSDNSSAVEVAIPVIDQQRLYYLAQNTNPASGTTHHQLVIYDSEGAIPSESKLKQSFEFQFARYAYVFASNKNGDLSKTILLSQGAIYRFKNTTNGWQAYELFSNYPLTYGANGFTADSTYTISNSSFQFEMNLTLQDAMVLEDDSYLIVDGGLIRLLDRQSDSVYKLATLMGENPAKNPTIKYNGGEVYTVTHPLSLKLGLLSNLKPYRSSPASAFSKLLTFDHFVGKMYEFNSSLTEFTHIAGNGVFGNIKTNNMALETPLLTNHAGARASTVGYNSIGDALYGEEDEVYRMTNNYFYSDIKPIHLNKNPLTRKSTDKNCLTYSTSTYSDSTYQYALLSDANSFQAVASNYYDYVCNSHRSSHISILEPNATPFVIGNSDVMADNTFNTKYLGKEIPSCFLPSGNVDINNCNMGSLRHNAGATSNNHSQVSKVGTEYWISSSKSGVIIRVSPSLLVTNVVLNAGFETSIWGFAPFKETSGSNSLYACADGVLAKWTNLFTQFTERSTTIPQISCRGGNLIRKSDTSNNVLFLMPQTETGTTIVEYVQ